MAIHLHLQVGCLPLMVCANDGTAADTIGGRGPEGKGNPAVAGQTPRRETCSGGSPARLGRTPRAPSLSIAADLGMIWRHSSVPLRLVPLSAHRAGRQVSWDRGIVTHVSEWSVSPAGEKFELPKSTDYAGELQRLETLAGAARAEGKEIVVVMGVGFVGAVMAAIIADTVDKKTGKPSKFVIGCQRPSPRSYWKIPLLNRGQSPVKAEDPEVDPMIARCVKDKKTLVATYNSDCLKLADCVVVDVQCDYTKHELGNMRTGEAEMTALEATMRTIGEKIEPELPRADRDDRRPGHDGVRRLADHEEGLRPARHQVGPAAEPQLRAGHARPGVRLEHPRLLAGLLRLHPRGPRPRRQVPHARCSTPRSSR